MNIHVLGPNKESIDLTPNVQSIQRKINKLDFIKFENFCYNNSFISLKQLEQQATYCENLFISHKLTKG